MEQSIGHIAAQPDRGGFGGSFVLPVDSEADLFQPAMGRNGECPVPILAATTPSDCFNMAIEASRIALKFMTPVILLTDGYVANGAGRRRAR